MVSFHTPLTPDNQRRMTAGSDQNLPKKRKWEQPQAEEQSFEKPISKAETTRPMIDIELHLETPLPVEWQRCLDIQSGKIHFYNTMTQKRTSKDPRRRPTPTSSPADHTNLDLELNLTCESHRKSQEENHPTKQNNGSARLARGTTWFGLERDDQEMVATVCMQCHLLVMLCKSTPACPNCKFMHPPNQTPPTLFKRCSLSCL